MWVRGGTGQLQGLGDRHLPTLCSASTLYSSFAWAGVVLTQGDVHNTPPHRWAHQGENAFSHPHIKPVCPRIPTYAWLRFTAQHPHPALGGSYDLWRAAWLGLGPSSGCAVPQFLFLLGKFYSAPPPH